MLNFDTLEKLNEIARNKEDCPLTRDGKCAKGKCPSWWSFDWEFENVNDRRHKVIHLEGCGLVLLPVFVNDLIGTVYVSNDIAENKYKEFEQNILQQQQKTNLALAILVRKMEPPKKDSLVTLVGRKVKQLTSS